MKMPAPPPDIRNLVKSLTREQVRRLVTGKPLVDGRYLHWDHLRHREPPAGLTREEWWLGIRFARDSASETMPLMDTQGRPLRLAYVAPIRKGLHEIDQRFGVTGTSPDATSIEDVRGESYFRSNALMEEAIRSSQLEGATTTRARAKDMIREHRDPMDRGERMILNNFHAMERVEELVGEELTLASVFELHRILVDGTLENPTKAGTFRAVEDQVVVELLNTVETAHVPPQATELPERMTRLVDFANGKTPDEWLHPVLRAVILHFMVGYDHPFVDGNGRVARALFYWAMAHHGYPLARFLTISRVLREAPAKYARAYLYTETDGGDLTYFVDHQLQVILQSIEALTRYAQAKVKATRRLEQEIRASPQLNHRQLRLLGHALRNPGFEYTVRSHQMSHRVVNNTARADLAELADRGLLVKSRRGRKHIFLAPRDLERRLAGK
ncbi:MAG: Fic family protein [Gemmatimonadota bacterium]